MSSAETGKTGSLGERPLLVLRAGSITASPEFREAWTNAQSDLIHEGERDRGGRDDLLHDVPDAIVEGVRQVTEVRMLK
jgi:hypothetical protein